MKHRMTISFVAALVAWGPALAAEMPSSDGSGGAASARQVRPVTDAMLQNPEPGSWLMWRRTLDAWGYSPLDQINTRNVGRLRMVWTRGLEPGLQEGTPLVHDGVMYYPNPNDVVQALDAASGQLIWEYRRKLPEDIGKAVPFPAINRNLAIYGNLIIDTSADDFVYALDAATGKLAWESRILDYKVNPAQQTSGPIIANGKIISGRGCEPKAGPEACVITAHDARTGKELWRTRTIPGPGEPGDASWGNVPFEKRWHVGTWLVPSYDPELNLIYIGTSVTSPAPKFILGGVDKEHLYHNSTLAIDADTGRIVWHYQHLIDHWDLDHTFERLLIDTVVAPSRNEVSWINPRVRPGERRKVMTGIPGKTGIVYTLDRQTGEFLWAKPTIRQNVVREIDGATGKVMVNPEAVFTAVGDRKHICPSLNGGKNWQAGAYSPLSGLMYYPMQNTCSNVVAVSDQQSLESLYAINSRGEIAPGVENVGSIHAISVETGETRWKFEQRAGTMSLLASGGGLLFGGDMSGYFRAFDQRTGKVLWEVNLGSSVTGFPVTYSVDGKQYVAVSTGSSLASGGIMRLTPELRPSNASNLFVFALPD